MIAKNMTLTPDKHYRVVSDLAIPEGVTLKIEPGTKLILDAGVGISSKGKLIADGEPGKMIEFTCDNGRWGTISVSHDERIDGVTLVVFMTPCVIACLIMEQKRN